MLWSEWTASSWISFRCAFLLCSNCLFSYLWNSSWKKVSVRQSCFGPGLKKCVFRRVRFHPLQMFALVFWDHLLKFEANEAVIWWLEVFQIPKSQTLRTTPFVVIHSLSSGTPLNESMRLFQACFSRLNHTQSTVSKYASFWDFDLDEYQKLHLSNCIEKPGFSIFLVVFLLAFVPEKPSCVPIAGHPQLPHLFIPNSQAQETRHDFGGTIEGGTGPSPEDNFCEKWWISTFFWMEFFGMNPWTLFFFSSFQLCSPDFFLEFLFCGMFWGLFLGVDLFISCLSRKVDVLHSFLRSVGSAACEELWRKSHSFTVSAIFSVDERLPALKMHWHHSGGSFSKNLADAVD